MSETEAAHPIDLPEQARAVRYSAVIPVYNSQDSVGEVITRCLQVFDRAGLDGEVVAVNDGSTDGSWEAVRRIAAEHPAVVAVDLLRNYGQHNALVCGFAHASGDYVITLDDDLQNPPEEMIHLIRKIHEGYDLVFGRFAQKQHATHRRLGSRVVTWINRRVFDQPRDLTISNFRILTRDVVQRICAFRTGYPYVPGLAMMHSGRRASVDVRHEPRKIGTSGYGFVKITELVMRILFNYSSYPLRVVTVFGAFVAVASMAVGVWFGIRALMGVGDVPGWASIVVLLTFLNGVTVLMLSMIGEYLVRLLRQTSTTQNYHVRDVVGGGR